MGQAGVGAPPSLRMTRASGTCAGARKCRGSTVGRIVRDPQGSAKWYAEALGMEVMNYSPQMEMAFLSFGTLDQDIALIKAPEGVATGSPGLTHTAMAIDGGPDELKEIYHRVRAAGAAIEMTADHGVSKSFYFFDPDGNRLEVFCQALHGDEAMTFMRDVGAMLEPYPELEG